MESYGKSAQHLNVKRPAGLDPAAILQYYRSASLRITKFKVSLTPMATAMAKRIWRRIVVNP